MLLRGEAWLRKTAMEKTKPEIGPAVHEPGPGLCVGGRPGHHRCLWGLRRWPLDALADSGPSPEVPGARGEGAGVKARALCPSAECLRPVRIPVVGSGALHYLSCSDVRSPVLRPAAGLASTLGAAQSLQGPPSWPTQACRRLRVPRGRPWPWSGPAA